MAVVATEVPTPVLIAAIVSLCSVIGYLFRLYDKRLAHERQVSSEAEAERALERTAWAVERAKLEMERERITEELRANYEEKFRDLLERYDEAAGRERAANRAHEDAQRKEYAEVMETVAAKAGEASQATVEMLNKFLDRFAAPRARR